MLLRKISLIVCLFFMMLSTPHALPKQAQLDLYKLQLRTALKNQDCNLALDLMKKIELKQNDIPSSLQFFKGKCYYQNKNWSDAAKSFEIYIERIGRKGRLYKRALNMYVDTQKNIDELKDIHNSIGRYVLIPSSQTRKIKSFRLGEHEITKGAFAIFVNDTGYTTDAENDFCWALNGKKQMRVSGASWRNPGFEQNDNEPVVCVSWKDVHEYIKWLNEKSSKTYRLPTEREWDFVAYDNYLNDYIAGSTTICEYGNGNDLSLEKFTGWDARNNCNDGYKFTAPVKSYKSNIHKIYNMNGNVSEYMEDCSPGDCSKRRIRGGSFLGSISPGYQDDMPLTTIATMFFGFRLVQEVELQDEALFEAENKAQREINKRKVLFKNIYK